MFDEKIITLFYTICCTIDSVISITTKVTKFANKNPDFFCQILHITLMDVVVHSL